MQSNMKDCLRKCLNHLLLRKSLSGGSCPGLIQKHLSHTEETLTKLFVDQDVDQTPSPGLVADKECEAWSVLPRKLSGLDQHKPQENSKKVQLKKNVIIPTPHILPKSLETACSLTMLVLCLVAVRTRTIGRGTEAQAGLKKPDLKLVGFL